LGNRGRVTNVITAGQSKFYFIRLASGTNIGSVAMQPDARHYVVTTQTALSIPNANALISTLQQRNLAEIHQYLVREYFGRNPQHLNEFKHGNNIQNELVAQQAMTNQLLQGLLQTTEAGKTINLDGITLNKTLLNKNKTSYGLNRL
jgi:hypothetical protein